MADIGFDFTVVFDPTTGSDVEFNCNSKQLVGFTSSEVEIDYDNPLYVTKRQTISKPTLTNPQLTAELIVDNLVALRGYASSGVLGDLIFTDKDSGSALQTVENVRILDCTPDATDNSAWPTMTVSFLPQGEVAD